MAPKTIAAALATALLLRESVAAPTANSIVVPTIEGPITGGIRGHPFASYLGNISDIGYVEEEYFLSGNSQNYSPVGELTPDGLWSIQPNTTAPFKVRILVRRPADSQDFNGDAVLEWINVSAGYEILISDSDGLYEAGYAFVAVSAQPIGLFGYNIPGIPRFGLTQWDPERYGSLTIEDDSFSYDIFTQAVNAVKSGKISGLKAQNVIAVGESQSALRLNSYANGVQPITNAIDAIIPVVSGGISANFGSGVSIPGANASALVQTTKIRTDLHIPVHQINSETEAILNFESGARQSDTNLYRYWEIAGSGHGSGIITTKIAEYAARDQIRTQPTPANVDAVSWLPTADIAYRYASAWIRGQGQPPHFPLLETKIVNNTVQYVVDAFGNVLGGARQPEVNVPIATYNGSGDGLVGTTTPFNASALAALYPTHLNYVAKISAAALAAQKAGLILPIRVQQLVNAANQANVPPSST